MPENFVTFVSTHQWVIVLVAVWTILWKGVALWRASGNRSIAWFIVLLLINTLGILDIIYIFAFSKKKDISQPIEPQKTQAVEKAAPVAKTKEKKKPGIDPSDSKDPEDATLDVKVKESAPNLDEEAPKS